MAKSKIKGTVGPRWAKFCGWWLRKKGWTSDSGPMKEPKSIVLGVPHTSTKDFLICYLFYAQSGKLPHIMIKKEFFFWPMGPILRSLGAVPIDRSSNGAMLRSLIYAMESVPEFHLAMAVEGTRKATRNWKSGYHLIAKETGAAVYLGYFDWGTKHIGCGEKFELTDDAKADMQRIYDHYRPMGLQGYHKDQFIVP